MITDENIGDILAAAFEGGINYWCDEVKVVDDNYMDARFASDAVSRGAIVKLHLSDYEDPVPELLTRKTIVKGIEMAAIAHGLSVDEFIENHDAEDADMAVQFAVFGKLVFG
jgi:hypothetical protein